MSRRHGRRKETTKAAASLAHHVLLVQLGENDNDTAVHALVCKAQLLAQGQRLVRPAEDQRVVLLQHLGLSWRGEECVCVCV